MSKAVGRVGDPIKVVHDNGQPIVTPGVNLGSPDVFANGLAVTRHGDESVPHGHIPPYPTLIATSGTVYINGKLIGRVDDTYTCSSILYAGSSTVFSN